MLTSCQLKHTPLYDEHIRLGAKMVAFGGWEMPLQYEGILAEYESTRRQVALFDTSHMGEFLIEGDARECGLDRLVTQPLIDMPEKTGRYGVMCREDGGVIDDCIVFRVGRQKWYMVVNGATAAKDAEHVSQKITPSGRWTDLSAQTGKLDVQGPSAREILKQFVTAIERLDYFACDVFPGMGEEILISRTGYTGELGYEIFCPWEKTLSFWRALLDTDQVKPAGLGARDVLRTEMGYSLYGNELKETITPLEAGLKRFIDFDKDFIGKTVLLRQLKEGVRRQLICLIAENRRSPRPHNGIFNETGERIGEVTSGTFSPYLKRGIGLGLVLADPGRKDNCLYFGDQHQKTRAAITTRPFYKLGSLKNY